MNSLTAFSVNTLTDVCLIRSFPRTSQPPWQYPITEKLSPTYSRKSAQSLLEFSYRVSVHNREVDEGNKDPLRLDPPNFDVVIPLNTTYFFKEVNVLWFFYSSSMNIVTIVATSTYNNLLFLVDLNYLQLEPKSMGNYIPGVKVHGGFWNFYLSIHERLISLLQKYVNNETQVILTGLSLGGAISTIGAIDLYQKKLSDNLTMNNIIHYSFASPRAFDIIGTQHYNSLKLASYRIHNGSDIIPVVPLPIMPASLTLSLQNSKSNTSSNSDTLTEKSINGQLNYYYFMHVENLIYFDRNIGDYYGNHILAYLNEYDLDPSFKEVSKFSDK